VVDFRRVLYRLLHKLIHLRFRRHALMVTSSLMLQIMQSAAPDKVVLQALGKLRQPRRVLRRSQKRMTK
jgi:hypothetical protein